MGFMKPQELVGKTVDRRFKIVEIIGEGTTGVVYKGELAPFKKSVAIKMLKSEYMFVAEHESRFEKEAHVLGRLRHPNSVWMYDYIKENGRCYLVMEFVDGETLSERISRVGTICAESVVRIILQISQAIAEAHSHGIIHRDIKPANIMLTNHFGQNDFVKVLDYSVAHVIDKNATAHGVVLGTPLYMSPEQRRGDSVSVQSDIFSLGVLAYQMLTGEFPYQDIENYSDYSQYRPIENVPLLLAQMINEALERNSKRRQATMDVVIGQCLAILQEYYCHNHEMGSKYSANVSSLKLDGSDVIGIEIYSKIDINDERYFAERKDQTLLDVYAHRLAWCNGGESLVAQSTEGVQVWNVESSNLEVNSRFRTDASLWQWYRSDGENDKALMILSGKIFEYDLGSGYVSEIKAEIADVNIAGKLSLCSASSDGRFLVIGYGSGRVDIVDTQVGIFVFIDKVHRAAVSRASWTQDNDKFATVSSNQLVLWSTSESSVKLERHITMLSDITAIAWSSDGILVATGHNDASIIITEASSGRQLFVLHGHTEQITALSFSSDCHLLCSVSSSHAGRIWRTDRWETMLIIDGLVSDVIFHPYRPSVAVLTYSSMAADQKVFICKFDVDLLSESPSHETSPHYTNAKVVLLGNSGVGKSGLGLVLSNRRYAPTESTHARSVWTLEKYDYHYPDGRTENREVLLWDLAGQPGYRLIHQLHLSQVEVALIVFDASDPQDKFTGVRHWVRALNQVNKLQENSSKTTRLLVAARTDRGHVILEPHELSRIRAEWKIVNYFPTSAKEGWGISELAKEIHKSIKWEQIPKVSSSKLFYQIKEFIERISSDGHLLLPKDELFLMFTKRLPRQQEHIAFRREFEACLQLSESTGLIRRLSFGTLILLRPEILDAYASSLVQEAERCFGMIPEDDALNVRFPVNEQHQIDNPQLERMLVIAVVEDMVRQDIAFRQSVGDDNIGIIFPSQITNDIVHNGNIVEKIYSPSVLIDFEGSVMNIYATLVVRLSHSGLFSVNSIYKRTVIFNAKFGGSGGFFLEETEEGHARLSVFYSGFVLDETMLVFETYIITHLNRMAADGSVKIERVFRCPSVECATVITKQQAENRRRKGFSMIKCPVCDEEYSILGIDDRLSIRQVDSKISSMDTNADMLRDRAADYAVLRGKIEVLEYDVFIVCDGLDRAFRDEISDYLRMCGINPLSSVPSGTGVPGEWTRRDRKRILESVKATVVLIPPRSLIQWNTEILNVLLQECKHENIPAIPVLLPGISGVPDALSGLREIDPIRIANAELSKQPAVLGSIVDRIRSSSREYRPKFSRDARTDVNEKKLSLLRPTRSSLRRALDVILRTDSDVDMFILDYFPRVYKRLATSMQRINKINVLFEIHDTDEILKELRDMDPDGVERNQKLLEFTT